jgi:hypothetical protein
MYEIPQGTMCYHCGKHSATHHWYGDTSVMGFVHMDPEFWCECCCLREQIVYAEKQAAKLPQLRSELEQACV